MPPIMSAKAQQVSSWLDDAPMPPPMPGFPDPFGQFPSTSYADPRDTFSPHFAAQIKTEPGTSIMSPENVMSPHSSSSGSLTPRADAYGGSFSIKREVDTPFSITSETRADFAALKFEDTSEESASETVEEEEEIEEEEDEEPEIVQHIIAEDVGIFERNIKTENGWIVCLFHDEYEKDQEPRATFTTMNNHFVIDGLLTPENYADTSDRFCLGKSVIQTNLTKLVRMIGKGVEITRDDTGNVTLKNVGPSAVFVLSPDFAVRNGDPYDTVYKLHSARDRRDNIGRQMLIFDAQLFETGLRNATTAFDLDKLTMSCFTRMSFLKGFGRNYPARPDITNCPLWVEMKICGPLNEIDQKFRILHPDANM